MTEMTLKEAVRVRARVLDVLANGGTFDGGEYDAAKVCVFAHAERTIAARSGEPEIVTAIRRSLKEELHGEHAEDVRDLLAHLDTLTARLAAAERERDEAEDGRMREYEPVEMLRRDFVDPFISMLLERNTARAELAAMRERVVRECRKSFDVRARGKCPDCGELVDQTTQAVGLVRAADILAALDGTP